MCNYNRQSKTKPFTFNEFLLEKGRLPQGGILMKQMAECSQGQTQTVLLFYSLPTFPAFWGASPVSWPLFVCICESMWACMCVYVRKRNICLLTTLARWREKIITVASHIRHSLHPDAHTGRQKHVQGVCILHCAVSKWLFQVQLTACSMWTEKKKHSRQVFLIFYSIPFYFIQYVCLSTMQFLPHSFHRHTSYEPRLLCVWLSCGSAQCPAGTHPVTPYL